MENTAITTIITIILPLLGAGIGFLIKHNIEKRKELMSEVTKTRRELYQRFVDLIIDIFANTRSGKHQPENQLIRELYSFYKKYVLYASPEVIITYADYFQFLYTQESSDNKDIAVHFKKLTKILIAMRKDLGLKNNGLGTHGQILFRALIKDYDTVIK